MNSKLFQKISFVLAGLLSAYGLYIGSTQDIWGWIPYALVLVVIGTILLKKNGTQRQAQSAAKTLKIFIALGILAAAMSVAYLIWMSGFTF